MHSFRTLYRILWDPIVRSLFLLRDLRPRYEIVEISDRILKRTVEGTNLSSELIEIPKATLLLLYSFFTTRLEADKWAAVKQTERWFAIVLNRKLIKDKLSPGGTIPASRKRKTSLRWKGKGYVEFSMRFHRVRSVKRRDNRVEQTLRGGLEEEGGDLWRKNVWQRGATGQGRVLFSIYPSPTQPRLFRGIGSQRNTRGGCSRSISRGTCLGFLPGPSLPRDTSRFLL